MKKTDRAYLDLVADATGDDPIADRLLYAAFPGELKTALRAAAARHRWDRETWRRQTQLIHSALKSGACPAALAAAYQNQETAA